MSVINNDPDELNEVNQRPSDPDRALLMAVFARLDGVAMVIAMGTVCGLGLFAATAFLLIKGAPPGVPIGPNLSSLGSFLPGYSVSWAGSIAGAIYAALIGGAIGGFIALLWNFAHLVYVGIIAIHARWLE